MSTCLTRFLFGALTIYLMLPALSPTARAHDSWIAQGGFRSPVSKEWCCGVNDCFVIAPHAVHINGVGYELAGINEVVPYSEALPSQDGQYWRCHRPNGTRRCFFAPPMGY